MKSVLVVASVCCSVIHILSKYLSLWLSVRVTEFVRLRICTRLWVKVCVADGFFVGVLVGFFIQLLVVSVYIQCLPCLCGRLFVWLLLFSHRPSVLSVCL